MYEVAERFYQELIPQAREIAHQAEVAGQKAEAEAVRKVIDDLLNRPEHTWYEEMKTTLKKGAADHAAVVVPAVVVPAVVVPAVVVPAVVVPAVVVPAVVVPAVVVPAVVVPAVVVPAVVVPAVAVADTASATAAPADAVDPADISGAKTIAPEP